MGCPAPYRTVVRPDLVAGVTKSESTIHCFQFDTRVSDPHIFLKTAQIMEIGNLSVAVVKSIDVGLKPSPLDQQRLTIDSILS